jgi:hypothetical protein
MNRFILQPGEHPGFFVCTDRVNGVVCVFKEHKFNEMQNFTLLEDFDPKKYAELAKFLREMGEWLNESHPEKVF